MVGGGAVNNNPWQSTFGKLLIASSIIAAVAGFAIVSAFKDGPAEPVEQAASNEALEMEPGEPSVLDERELPAPVAEQAATEARAEPDAGQFAFDEQTVDQSATERATDEGGVQQ
jgi:hypothetical protein